MSSQYIRYNAGIQRAKGFFEVASALYEGSLSERQVDPTTGAVQNISPVGHQINIQLINESKEIRKNPINLVLETGGFHASLNAVAEKKISVLWISSSIALTMAYLGTGPFEKPLPVRALAVFPSWDVLGFAVHESTGIKRLEDIKEKRVPLNLSARKMEATFTEQKTMFIISSVLKSVGTSLAEIQGWGGKFQAVPRPSDHARRAAIISGEVNAVFDEGVVHWGPGALAHGFRFLSVEGENLARLQKIGFQVAMLTDKQLPGLKGKIASPNIGGFPMVVHAEMPDAVAYGICDAIERRKESIPVDVEGGLDMAKLCSNDDDTPLNVPLHPGAERFYRERGYLKG
jgi:TRAP-type uncharacterized transport system substrate-binding protein